MNNHKTLWKTSNFEWIRILLCIVPLFVPIWADVTYDNAKFRIFDNKKSNFEAAVFKSLQTTKNFFAQPEVKNAVLVSVLGGVIKPWFAPLQAVLFVVQGLCSSESDWKQEFSKAIEHETKREIALSELSSIRSNMKSIDAKFDLLIENKTKLEKKHTVGIHIHIKIDDMLNFFAEGESLFKKFPFLGTPLLLQLAQVTAIFDTVAKILIPEEAVKPDLSCKMRDILIDFRRHTVNARLEKLHAVSKIFYSLLPEIDNVMSIEYNQYGYNKTNPGRLSCEKGCTVASRPPKYCLKDDFGDNLYTFPPYSCVTDYALLVRHRVEQMFPVELLNSTCTHPARPTGFGWLTIKLREVVATRTHKGDECDAAITYCDPFVKLFIDNIFKLDTPVKENSWHSNVDVTSTWYIRKSAKIKIEVWDSNYGKPDLIIRTDGNVDSFLKKGHRSVTHRKIIMGKKYDEVNYINTVSFWQDEYPASARADK